MTYADLLEEFGSEAGIAKAFGVSTPSVYGWRDKGVPPLRQIQGEALTKKRLKADPGVFDIPSDRARAS